MQPSYQVIWLIVLCAWAVGLVVWLGFLISWHREIRAKRANRSR